MLFHALARRSFGSGAEAVRARARGVDRRWRGRTVPAAARLRLWADLLEDRLAPAVLDLTSLGAVASLNNATDGNPVVFGQTSPTSTGSGVINSFVRLEDKNNDGLEQGYNSDHRPVQFDESTTATFNHSLLLSSVPRVNIGGRMYREFFLDINQSGGATSPNRLLSLDELRFYVSNNNTLNGYDPGTRTLGGVAPLYDLDAGGDNWIKLDASLTSGSGSGDMRAFIPDTLFDTSKAFVTVYSKFGINHPANDGFEEWSVGAAGVATVATGRIHGYTFSDVNGDGADNDGPGGMASPRTPGVTVYMDANNNGSKDAGEVATITAATGEYEFRNLAAGLGAFSTYRVRELVPAGAKQTTVNPPDILLVKGDVYVAVANQPGALPLLVGETQKVESKLTFGNQFNQPPVANNDAFATAEDTTLNVPAPGVLANDTDPNGDKLSAVLVTAPAHGSLTLNADGSFSYAPEANFGGSDSFTYKANDGTATSNEATVTITVTAVNDAPVAAPDAYTATEDAPLTVSAPGVLGNDTDVDGNELTAVLVSDVSHGSLTFNANGSFTYNPHPNFNGSDSFTYKANDGTTDSNVATVTLTVNAVNDAPVAAPDAYSTGEDTPLIVPAPGVLGNDNDVDGDALTAILETGPAHGTLALNADGSFSYVPNANFNGSDSFTYKAGDGTAFSEPVTVGLTVTAANDPPVAAPDLYTTPEDTTFTVPAPGVLANDKDVDGDPLTAILVSGPSHGTLTWHTGTSSGSFNDTTVADFGAGAPAGTRVVAHAGDGEVTLTPTISEEFSGSGLPAGWSGAEWSAGGTVTVAGGELSVNGARAATDASYSAGRSLEFAATFGAEKFQHAGFVADLDFNAPWAIFSTSNTNSDLYARTNTGAMQLDTLIPGTWLGTEHLFRIDWDGAVVSYYIDGSLIISHSAPIATDMRPVVSDFAPGGAGLSVDWLQMTPYNLAGSFESRVFDAGSSVTWDSASWAADTPTGTNLTLSVRTGNTPTPDGTWTAYTPLAGPGAPIGQTGRYLQYRADLTTDDPDQTPVLFDVTLNSTAATGGNGSFTYTPDPNFTGVDTFEYKANDGQADSNVAKVTITVTPVNDPPVAKNDTYGTVQATPLVVPTPGVLGNDSDVDGDPLTAELVTGPTHGTLVLNKDGSFAYSPADSFSGTDSFTYKAKDPSLALSNLATVTITVTPVNVSIGDVSANEGTGGTTAFDFVVSLSQPSSQKVTVNYTTADGSATAPADFVPAAGTVVFMPGETSQKVTVQVNGDTTFEPDETFFVHLSTPTSATITDGQGLGTIVNDDAPPTISIGDYSFNEGDAATTPFTFTVTLSNPSFQTVTVNYATADDTAKTGNDYVAAGATVTFNPGETTKTVTVDVVGDLTFEPNETFFVNLSGATNASIADDQGVGTIVNDDPVPAIAIDDEMADEGNGGITPFTFTVTLSNPSYQTVTVNYATADGTATTMDNDYKSAGGTVNFAPGETSKQVTVNVVGDTKFEPHETFLVNLSGASNATVAKPTGTGTILNDDPQPTISIEDVAQAEGNAGTTAFTFTVTLSNASSETITVEYDTSDGTALTADSDYLFANGTVTFAPGDTSETVTVHVLGDTKFEPDEFFFVNLFGAKNATIDDPQGQGTIENDDPEPTISIDDVSLPEGSAGLTTFTFTVSLSNASYQPVSVNYATSDGSALLGDADYAPAAAAVTFAPGATTQTITVVVNGDTKFEPDETFTVNLSTPIGGTIADATGLGTIRNDDAPPTIRISDSSAHEGNADTTPFTFTVTLSNPSFQTVTVNYATADGTATVTDNDYQFAGGTVTFAPGQISQTVTVDVVGDTKFEQNESFFVSLSGAANATIADGQGVGTIVNDDAPPTVAIDNVADAEGKGGTTPFTFTVLLSNPSYQTVTVNFATADGTATTADSDYLAASGSVTFDPGETNQSVTVFVVGDRKVELDETFFVNLTGATNATLVPGTMGTGTIQNDDHGPVAVPDAYSTNEDTTLSVPAPGVLGNDTDADGDTLQALLVSGPTQGTLVLNSNGSFTYMPAANYNGADQFVYKANDGANDSAPTTVVLTVVPVNDPPVVTAINITPEPSNEGQLVQLKATFTDPDLGDTHTATIKWGDGTTTTGKVNQNMDGSYTVTGEYAYPDDDPTGTSQDTYTVTVTVTDLAGAPGSKSAPHVVKNVDPVIDEVICPPAPVPVGTTVAVTGKFSDAGVRDTHTAVWDWGDGTKSAGTVLEAGGQGTVSGTHTYTAEGVYTLTLTVTDDDGGSATHVCETFVVVFGLDTKVTGGGWFQSPPGAYRPNPAVTGRANFGFNAKYHVGSDVPQGHTNFRFGPANIHFVSTAYDRVSLIVVGNKAEWRGEGKLNNRTGYGFQVNVTDGGEPQNDSFRIKIWDKALGEVLGVVYDNGPVETPLGGGNIQIHGALELAGPAGSGPAAGRPLTVERLDPIVTEAVRRWGVAGGALGTPDVRVADLPGTLLGVTAGGTIWLDQDAAGHGWFIDPTPADDHEFEDPGAAPRGLDLLTAVAHELGHLLGLDHGDEHEVMATSLPPGVRMLPGSEHLAPEDHIATLPTAHRLSAAVGGFVPAPLPARLPAVAGGVPLEPPAPHWDWFARPAAGLLEEDRPVLRHHPLPAGWRSGNADGPTWLPHPDAPTPDGGPVEARPARNPSDLEGWQPDVLITHPPLE